jgi:hypothetical protein
MSQSAWDIAVETNDFEERRKIEEWATYFLCTFCHSLRGWETVKAIVSNLRSQIVSVETTIQLGVDPHMGLPLYGRFKSCGNANSHLLCMIAAETESGLQPLLWTQRLLVTLDKAGLKLDWLSQENDWCGTRRGMSSFNDYFYDALIDIQRRMPELIDEETMCWMTSTSLDCSDEELQQELSWQESRPRLWNGLTDGEQDWRYWSRDQCELSTWKGR